MDLKNYFSIQINENSNAELVAQLQQKLENVAESENLLLEAWKNNKDCETKTNELCNLETEQRNQVNQNNGIIAQLKIQIQLANNEYNSYVQEKEYQFKEKSEKIIQETEHTSAISAALMKQFGFKLKLNIIDPEIWAVKFIFNECHELCFHYNIFDEHFTLVSIQPQHLKFSEIKKFLETTQDISGLLYTIRKYFNNIPKS